MVTSSGTAVFRNACSASFCKCAALDFDQGPEGRPQLVGDTRAAEVEFRATNRDVDFELWAQERSAHLKRT